MPVSVALLRGVNVGGKNRLPMADLTALLRDAGATEVQTYIQSGNAVLRADDPGATAARFEAALGARFGHPMPVAHVTAEALLAVPAGWPLGDAAPEARHVGFLCGDARGAPDPARSPGDDLALVGRVLYLHLPRGVAASRYTSDWLDRQTGVAVTVRNWRTLLALCEITQVMIG